MSRSTKKVASYGICYGNNAPWKKQARQANRVKNKQLLDKFVKGLLSADELMTYDKRWHCSEIWCEPTDGKVVLFNLPHYKKKLNSNKWGHRVLVNCGKDVDQELLERFKRYLRK